MRYFFIFLFFLLSNCSGYSVVSLTSNIITYSATGKTNHEHVAYYITGKHCRMDSVVKDKNICKEKDSIFAESKNENIDVASLNIVANDSNLIIKEIGENYSVEEEIKVAYVERLFNNIYYGSISWAEYQLTRGTKVSDKIGITENLTEEVEKAFNYFY